MIAWFVIPYKRELGADRPTRYCAVDDFTSRIFGDGGAWTESECLGGHAVVKVRASADVINELANTAGFFKFTQTNLWDSLSELSSEQRTTLSDKLQSLGYSLDEIESHLGVSWDGKTFLDLLNLFIKRRLKPRYDSGTDTIVLDGPAQDCRPIEEVDMEVS